MRVLPMQWRPFGYNRPSRYLQLVRSRGGIDAARHLVHMSELTEGFQRLRDAGRLELTVEYLILRSEYSCCFSAEERMLARRRLVENGYPRSGLPPEPTCGADS
jgi:hypothetical protein